MSSLDPIAYTYDADVHCPDCAFKRFGMDGNGFVPTGSTDSEGNEVGAIPPWDEWYADFVDEPGHHVLACGTCGREIDALEVPRRGGGW